MHKDDFPTDDHDEIIIISKSDQKRAAQELQDLGEQLLKLSSSQLDGLPLDELLREALDTAKRIKVGNALNRQMRYIGKLIGKTDQEGIQLGLAKLKEKDSHHENITQVSEKWREDLLLGDNKSIGLFIDKYPRCDKQKLNQLTRAASKEKKELESSPQNKKAKRHHKALFIFIRDTISGAD